MAFSHAWEHEAVEKSVIFTPLWMQQAMNKVFFFERKCHHENKMPTARGIILMWTGSQNLFFFLLTYFVGVKKGPLRNLVLSNWSNIGWILLDYVHFGEKTPKKLKMLLTLCIGFSLPSQWWRNCSWSKRIG